MNNLKKILFVVIFFVIINVNAQPFNGIYIGMSGGLITGVERFKLDNNLILGLGASDITWRGDTGALLGIFLGGGGKIGRGYLGAELTGSATTWMTSGANTTSTAQTAVNQVSLNSIYAVALTPGFFINKKVLFFIDIGGATGQFSIKDQAQDLSMHSYHISKGAGMIGAGLAAAIYANLVLRLNYSYLYFAAIHNTVAEGDGIADEFSRKVRTQQMLLELAYCFHL